MMPTKGKVDKLLRVGERAFDSPDAGKGMDVQSFVLEEQAYGGINPSWPLEKKMPPRREKTLTSQHC